MMSKRASYTREFKLEALRLMRESERKTADIARELGVRRNQLYKWQEEYSEKGERAFCGSGRPPKDSQSELARLRQDNKRLQEENEILKKAAVFFAKEAK